MFKVAFRYVTKSHANLCCNTKTKNTDADKMFMISTMKIVERITWPWHFK